MRLLLDTHVVLWWLGLDDRLAGPARDAIAQAEAVFVSAVSCAETAIKRSLGKLRMPHPLSVGVEASGFSSLPLTAEHAERLGKLPYHHRDPFDRLLIAQALEEGLTIVTHDRTFSRYRIPVLLS